VWIWRRAQGGAGGFDDGLFNLLSGIG